MVHGKREIRHTLAGLYDERTRDYEVTLTNYASTHDTAEEIEAFSSILADENEEERIRYASFYALNVIYRRHEDFHILDELIAENADDFSDHPTFTHLELLSTLDKGDYSNPYQLLSTARSDTERFARNAGYAHLYADLFATIYESRQVANREKYVAKWYQSALDAADRAIELDAAYAKFYCTRARILAIGEQYDRAIKEVQRSISLEDSNRPDYVIRLLRYYYHRIKIEVDRDVAELRKDVNRLEQLTQKLLEEAPVQGQEEVHVEAYDGIMPYVFVSYSHHDGATVLPLLAALQKRGVRLWFDQNIHTGSSWEEEIAFRVDGSEAVLFILSSHTKKSTEVTKEVTLASHARKLPICIFLEDNSLGMGQKYQLEGVQRINAYELDSDALIDRVLNALPQSTRGNQ